MEKYDLLEITLKQPDDFLKVRETLSRIGIASKQEKKLYQTAHILHKQGKYYLVHFKQLFELDNKPTSISDDDIKRRNTIAKLLNDWGLLEIVNKVDLETCSLNTIKILSFQEKSDWELCPKYNLGNNKS
jgi:hypothetical protein